MNAVDNLVTLIDQLQTIECSMTRIVTELIMKLCSLTNSSVFLIVESNNVRRVSGTTDLKSLYLAKSLEPSESDLEMIVDLNHEQNHERPLLLSSSFPRSSTVVDDASVTSTGATSRGGAATTAVRNRKREHSSSYLRHETDEKKSKNFDRDDNHHHHHHLHNVPNRGEMRDSFDSSEDVKPSFHSLSDADFAYPRMMIDETAPPPLMPLMGGENGDSDVEILEDCGRTEEENRPLEISHLEEENREDASRVNFSFTNCMEDAQFQAKAEALRQIEDPVQPFLKGTVENRLLSSVFYDYGKEICYNLLQTCPYPPDLKNPETNNYFMCNVNEFMKTFSNLRLNCPNSPIANLKIEVGSSRVRKYSPEAFARVNARNGFISRSKSLKALVPNQGRS